MMRAAPEIISREIEPVHEILEVKTRERCARELLVHIVRERVVNFAPKILAIVRYAAVRHVEFALAVVAEHRRVAVLPNEKENSCPRAVA